MSTTSFTPKDIKAAKAKYPDEPLLKLEIKKTRANKNKQQPTYYIPFVMKNVAGKYAPLYLKFVKQVIASSAKIPHGVEEEQAKDVRVAYRRLTESDLAQTDYEESKREILLKANEELIDAFNIIAEEYFSLVKREVLTYKGEMFKLQKNRTINCFRQDKRKASDGEEGDDEGMIDLPVPIYRVKLEADLETGKIGKSTEKGHRYIVFDMRKTTRQAAENANKNSKVPTKPVIAKISVQGKQTDLTIKNVKHFITYMSLTGGTIYFDSICISKSGISILCKFNDLHVLHHKVVKQGGLNADDIAEFAGFGTGSNEDNMDVVVDEPEESNEEVKTNKNKGMKGKSSKSLAKVLNNNDDGEQPLDDEPVDNDGGDEDTEQNVDDPDELTKQTKNEKSNKGKKSKSDDEEEFKQVKNTKETKKVKNTKETKKPVDEEEPEENAEGDAENEEPEENAEGDAENEEPEENAEGDAENNDENEEPEEPTKKLNKSESKGKSSKSEVKGASLKAGTRKK